MLLNGPLVPVEPIELRTLVTAVTLHRHRPAGLVLVSVDPIETMTKPIDDPGDVGEALIQTAVERIEPLLGPGDQVRRIDLDRVAVVLSDVTAPATADGLARRALAALSEPLRIDDEDLQPAVHFGVATTLRDDSADDLIRHAEHALAQAEISGPGEVVVFDDLDRELVEFD